MDGADNNPATKEEKKQKFRETLNALTSLENAVDRLESLTTRLCGCGPPKPETVDKTAEVDSVARLLSDTPDRIAYIEVGIGACTDRLSNELD